MPSWNDMKLLIEFVALWFQIKWHQLKEYLIPEPHERFVLRTNKRHMDVSKSLKQKALVLLQKNEHFDSVEYYNKTKNVHFVATEFHPWYDRIERKVHAWIIPIDARFQYACGSYSVVDILPIVKTFFGASCCGTGRDVHMIDLWEAVIRSKGIANLGGKGFPVALEILYTGGSLLLNGPILKDSELISKFNEMDA